MPDNNLFQVLESPVEKQGFTGTVEREPAPVFVPDFGGLTPTPIADPPPISIIPAQDASDPPAPGDVGCLTGCGPAFSGKDPLPTAVSITPPTSTVRVEGLNTETAAVMAGPFSPFFSMMIAGLPLWLWLLLAAVLVFNGKD